MEHISSIWRIVSSIDYRWSIIYRAIEQSVNTEVVSYFCLVYIEFLTNVLKII